MSENASGDEYFEIGEPERPKPASFKAKMQSFLDSRYFVAVCLVLVAITAFVLGRLSKIEEMREPVRVYNSSAGKSPSSASTKNNPPNPPNIKGGTGTEIGAQNTSGEVMGAATDSTSSPQVGSEMVVASKSGTKYHYPWCAGAKQISDKNKITFDTIAEARASGYTPASNCKGLK